MLIRFTAENVLCFKEEISISLVASDETGHCDHVIAAPNENGTRLLRASAIYGANGHGKTKVVQAIDIIRNLVVYGTKDDEQIPCPKFKLDRNSINDLSRIVIEFRVGKYDFEYGIAFFCSYISEEWLFSTNKNGKEVMIFERATNIVGNNEYENKTGFGSRLRRSKSPSKNVSMPIFLDVIAAGTRRNQPFLKEAVDKKVNALRPAYEWFRDTLAPIPADAYYRTLFRRARDEEDFLSSMSKFMSSADVGISGLKYREAKADNSLIASMPPHIMTRIEEGLAAGKAIEVGNQDGSMFVFTKSKTGQTVVSRLLTVRSGEDGTQVEFNMDEESSGTRRLIDLIPMLSSTKRNRVFVVDEIDRKLHPILARKFVELLFSATKSQLIFTTHNTYLLDLDLLRKDEIWFVQKKASGSSEVYSLSDIEVRPDIDIQKGYLSGRFGAIPFAGNIIDLGWISNSQDESNANS